MGISYYKRVISLQGAKDEQLKNQIIYRKDLATATLQYGASVAHQGNAPTAMGAYQTLNLGSITTARLLYVEWSGANFAIRITNADGENIIRLNSGGATSEKVMLIEGLVATGIAYRNTDATAEAPFSITVFGDE
jgi:hypothetical protein